MPEEPTTLPLDSQLCFSIYSASIAINRVYKPMLDALGVTYTQYLVLSTLWERDGLTISAIADRLKAGFAPVRKLGKLPSRTRRASYLLEYGMDSLEIHEDAAASGQRVLVVDDLLATGGTAAATVGLVRGLGASVVGVQFLIELLALNGRERLTGENVGAVLAY